MEFQDTPAAPDDYLPPMPTEPVLDVEEWLTTDDGLFRARWTDLGEGLSGEHDPDDPDDEPRLRVDVQVSDGDHYAAEEDASIYEDDSEGWFTCHDGSICTDVNTDTVTPAQRYRLLKSLLVDLQGHTGSVKGIMDSFSWVKNDSADTGPRHASVTP